MEYLCEIMSNFIIMHEENDREFIAQRVNFVAFFEILRKIYEKVVALLEK